jgi:hypothetical protein
MAAPSNLSVRIDFPQQFSFAEALQAKGEDEQVANLAHRIASFTPDFKEAESIQKQIDSQSIQASPYCKGLQDTFTYVLRRSMAELRESSLSPVLETDENSPQRSSDGAKSPQRSERGGSSRGKPSPPSDPEPVGESPNPLQPASPPLDESSPELPVSAPSNATNFSRLEVPGLRKSRTARANQSRRPALRKPGALLGFATNQRSDSGDGSPRADGSRDGGASSPSGSEESDSSQDSIKSAPEAVPRTLCCKSRRESSANSCDWRTRAVSWLRRAFCCTKSQGGAKKDS